MSGTLRSITDYLPTEIQMEILTHLDRIHQHRLLCICTKWNAMITSIIFYTPTHLSNVHKSSNLHGNSSIIRQTSLNAPEVKIHHLLAGTCISFGVARGMEAGVYFQGPAWKLDLAGLKKSPFYEEQVFDPPLIVNSTGIILHACYPLSDDGKVCQSQDCFKFILRDGKPLFPSTEKIGKGITVGYFFHVWLWAYFMSNEHCAMSEATGLEMIEGSEYVFSLVVGKEVTSRQQGY